MTAIPDFTINKLTVIDGPPNMLDTPPESPDIVSLPEAPWSEPGSPKVKTTVP